MEMKDKHVTVNFKSCLEISIEFGMVSVQSINESSLIKWRYFQSKDIPIVSLEMDDLVFVLAEYNNQEIIVKYNKVFEHIHFMHNFHQVNYLQSSEIAEEVNRIKLFCKEEFLEIGNIPNCAKEKQLIDLSVGLIR